MARSFDLGQNPNSKDAQAIADEIFAEFVSMEVDKVEMVYTKFKSLISSDPVVQSMLPLTPRGEMCDVDGNCIDAADDEIFTLTSKVCYLPGMRSLATGIISRVSFVCQGWKPTG